MRILLVLLLISGSLRAELRVGFGEADITPKLGDKPVYLAGFGQNRRATKVHDRLFARAIVLKDDKNRIALVSVDLVGYFLSEVEQVRSELEGFDYVLISSTHNHEGPDTLGLWGPSPFKSGVDPDYMALVRKRIVEAVRQADKALAPAHAGIGTARAPDLLHDGREPYVKHDTLVALRFEDAKGKLLGLMVQWNCHPETLGSKNTEISADFVTATVGHLQKKHACPVVYLTGTVGGLMTSLNLLLKDKDGKPLRDGTWEKTEHYGIAVGRLADKALADVKPVSLTPMVAKTRKVFLPLDNKLYLLGRQLGVLKREAYLWNEDPYQAKPAPKGVSLKRLALRTEIGYLKLGDLEVLAVPGEIYPELVLGKVQDPIDPGADFPDAKIEPALYDQLKGRHRMLIGLANDEVGYIIPRRQWDRKKPFCYGRKKDQYGEENSVGPEAAPILCEAFRKLISE